MTVQNDVFCSLKDSPFRSTVSGNRSVIELDIPISCASHSRLLIRRFIDIVLASFSEWVSSLLFSSRALFSYCLFSSSGSALYSVESTEEFLIAFLFMCEYTLDPVWPPAIQSEVTMLFSCEIMYVYMQNSIYI